MSGDTGAGGRRRTAAARDVPPPRPVPAQQPDARTMPDDGPAAAFTRAARALADAVGGLLADRPDEGGAAGNPAPGRSPVSGLRTVVGAVAGAIRAAHAVPTPDARAASAGTGTDADGSGPDRTPTALLGDLLAAAAPWLPVRDADRLRRTHPGAGVEEIADALVARAARATTGIGAATGGLAAVHWFAPASLLVVPLELGAETLLVAGVELVLIGELHELYGRRPPGDVRERTAAYLSSWSARRAVGEAGVPGLGAVLGAAGVSALRRGMTRRLVRSVPAAAPFLLGAALGGRGNRRATESLAHRLRADLRGRRPVLGRGAGG
jgi:hypothetical protein